MGRKIRVYLQPFWVSNHPLCGRGVTNRGARVDAAHARARERTTRDTGEDDPRDERRRVESS
jgi:hypothetical protein